MKNLTLIKQHNSMSVAHIYEHIVCDVAFKYFAENNLLKIFDYNIAAETLDGIVILDIDFDNPEKILNIIKNNQITDTDVVRGLEQINNEYQKAAEYKLDLLKKEINKIHQKAWINHQDNFISKAISRENASLNNSPMIRYKRKRPSDFSEISFVYQVKNIDLNLRPLAVYTLQFLALNQIILFQLNEKTDRFYDRGDEWAEYRFKQTDSVGYAHYFLTKKIDNFDTLKYKNIWDENYQKILSACFIEKLKKYLLSERQKGSHYFKINKMFAYSGAIIGDKYLAQIATTKNIESILDNLEINIELER